MNNIFPLEILPQGSLSSSVITTVWIGVWVVCFFNLRFGWVLSGLIIPGFLVPLMMAKPWSVGVIVIEAVVTYLIVRLASNAGSRYFGLFEVFGRERFFALVLVSVMVRIGFDGWLLPAFGLWVNESYELNFDYRNNLHSFGLIIISLLANTFWKPGLIRGMGSFLVMLFITYVIVRFGISEFANFNVSNLSYMYEDMSASILASPKAYIILIITAFIASRMNMRYGWEYNGILIPSLLALQWYQPLKLVVTLIEAGVILMIARLLLSLPQLARMNFEGARLLLLFFNISFFYKVLMGYLFNWFAPEIKVSDYFAFGYLLSTLLAMKMYEKNIALRMLRATMQSSLVAVIAASIIGFSMTLWLTPNMLDSKTSVETQQNSLIKTQDSLATLFMSEKITLLQGTENRSQLLPTQSQLSQFSQGLKLLQEFNNNQTENPKALANITAIFDQLQLQLIQGPDYWLLKESTNNNSWGMLILSRRHPQGLSLEIPYPMLERGVLESSLALFDQLQAGAMIIAAPNTAIKNERMTNVLHNPATFFHQAHLLLNLQGVIQIRANSLSSSSSNTAAGTTSNNEENLLWVKRSLPKTLSMQSLENYIGSFTTLWDTPKVKNIQRENSYRNFAELWLNKATLRRILASASQLQQSERADVLIQQSQQPLESMLDQLSENFATKGSQQYTTPSLSQLLFLDAHVISPLLALLRDDYKNENWSALGLGELNYIAQNAALFNYQITLLTPDDSSEKFLILHEKSQHKKLSWGVYVFRLNTGSDYVIEVPASAGDKESLHFSMQLFQQLHATAMFIQSAHLQANIDGSSNILQTRNKHSLFNLIHQSWLRSKTEDQSQHILQIRPYGSNVFNYANDNDILIALGRTDPKSASSQQLFQHLEKQGLRISIVDGQQAAAGYQVRDNAQQRYLAMAPQHQWSQLLLSPNFRRSLKPQLENTKEKVLFEALSINSQYGNLSQFIAQQKPSSDTSKNISNTLQLLYDFIHTQDIVSLRRLQQSSGNFSLLRYLDTPSGKSFLLIRDRQQRLVLLAHLHPLINNTEVSLMTNSYSAEDIKTFIKQGNKALLFTGASL